ncbi:transcriptional regulator [Xenorhabdus sp. PB62.4]|nr:transcriptional regulator [Xenorhabdus sp. PB62.4]
MRMANTPETWLKIQANYSLQEAKKHVDLSHLHHLALVRA